MPWFHPALQAYELPTVDDVGRTPRIRPRARPSSQLVRHSRVRGRSSSGEKGNIMALNTSLIAIIARRHPQIWEIVGGGPGGIRSRIDAVALNPQPLPPAFRYGAAVGRQVVQ